MWNALKRLLTANPMGLFIYGLFTKWYIVIATAGLIVLFWVLKGLVSIGVINAMEEIVIQVINDSKSIAKYCTPKIKNMEDFVSCLNSPPKYTPDNNETELQKKLDTIEKSYFQNNSSTTNPYE